MSKFELRDDEISGKHGFVLEHNGYDEGSEAWGFLHPIGSLWMVEFVIFNHQEMEKWWNMMA